PAPNRAPAPAAVRSVAPTGEGDGRLVALLRRNRWLRRGLSTASTAAILVAVAIIGYPFYTNLYAERLQGQLERDFDSPDLDQAYSDCRELRRGDPGCQIQDGDSLTRILIPDIDVDVVVVEGVSPSALRAGAGHYPSTPLPCEAGNVAIAGHRTTYGRPFHNLDLLTEVSELQPGSRITLEIPIGECTYEVTDIRIVAPTEVGVIAPTPDNQLTLTTCHPKGSAAQRLIVTARLVEGLLPPAAPA
ncbi:MAG: class E sortase, partial [Acidimicrobiia bacterium]|nr:class E sortase [Acidimicrobiia bacterium]